MQIKSASDTAREMIFSPLILPSVMANSTVTAMVSTSSKSSVLENVKNCLLPSSHARITAYIVVEKRAGSNK